MAKLTTWQATVQDDDTGAAVVEPVVTVRKGGPAGDLADLFDVAGSGIGNPVTGGTDGFVQFQTYPGRYWIQAADGGTFSQAWYWDAVPDEGLNWASRADLVTDWAAGIDLPDGAVLSAGTVQYVVSAGATAIADLQGVLPFSDVSPNHFGAVGDGVADDYAAMQATLDYINTLGGGVVEIQDGTYLTSQQLRVYANTRVRLSDNAIIRRNYNTSATGAGLFGVNGTPSNIHFEGGTLDCNGDTFQTGANIFSAVGARDISFTGVTFLDVPEFHAIDIADTDGVKVDKCRFMGFFNHSGTRGFAEAIQLDPNNAGGGSTVKGVSVTNCYFGDNPDTVTATPWPSGIGNHFADNATMITEGTVVSGCTFEGCTHGAISPYAWDNTVISGNVFEDCVRSIYLQQGTGTKTQGCVGVTITGNTFTGVGTNVIFADENNATDPDNALHHNITVSGNTFRNVDTAIRLLYAHTVAVTGNTATVYAGFLNLFDEVSGVTMAGNELDAASGTSIFVTGSSRNISISGNSAKNMAGRFFHMSGATDVALRENVSITDNLLVDCSAVVFIAADNGASKTFKVSGNTFAKGDANLEPSTGEVIRSTITGGGVVISDNHVSDELISKVPYAGSGGLIRAAINGSPEGVVTAGVGSEIIRKDGGAGTAAYRKESGTGNTGWVAK